MSHSEIMPLYIIRILIQALMYSITYYITFYISKFLAQDNDFQLSDWFRKPMIKYEPLSLSLTKYGKIDDKFFWQMLNCMKLALRTQRRAMIASRTLWDVHSCDFFWIEELLQHLQQGQMCVSINNVVKFLNLA